MTVSVVLPFQRPPPPYSEPLPETTLLMTVTEPDVMAMAPPKFPTVFPERVVLMTISVPELEMPPPPVDALLPPMVELITVTTPQLLMMPPPAPALLPSAMMRFWTVKLMLGFTEKTLTLFPPLIVIRLPPSIVVSALKIGRASCRERV